METAKKSDKPFSFILVCSKENEVYTYNDEISAKIDSLGKEMHHYYVTIEDFESDMDKIKDVHIEMVCIYPFHSHYLEPILLHFKTIKWVHCLHAGVEKLLKSHELDTNDNIILSNSKGDYYESFGEIGVLAIMYFNYNISNYIDKMRQKEFWKCPNNELINEKLILIIGYGNNGISFARKCKQGFNSRVIGVVRVKKENCAGKEFTDEIITMDELMDPKRDLSHVDFIFSTLPETKQTMNIYNLDFFKRFNNNVIFVNIGRGSAVVEDDLCYALENNIIRGALLDVTVHEPLEKDSKLYNIPTNKLLLTNHSLGLVKNYHEMTIKCLLENITSYLDTGKPINVVNKTHQY